MGKKPMTMTYDRTDLRILLNQAVPVGDIKAQQAIMQNLADEYDEIMRAEVLMEKDKDSP